MRIAFLEHAVARCHRYGVQRSAVVETLVRPDRVSMGHSGRQIAEKVVNDHVLRVVYNLAGGFVVVITVYRARRERYGL